MKRVKLKDYNDSSEFSYFLLESKTISKEKAKSIIFDLTNDKEFSLIDENGIQATNNGFWIVKKRLSDNEYVDLICLEKDNEFEIIE